MGQIYTWSCTSTSVTLTINEEMTPITCTVTPWRDITPRLTPTLPAGLTYSVSYGSGYQRTVTISGTPKEGLNPQLFYVGFNAWVSTIEIASKSCVSV